MTVKNIGFYTHIQHFYGLSTDLKPDTAWIGDLFTEIDTGDQFLFNGTTWVARASQSVSLTGSLPAGTNNIGSVSVSNFPSAAVILSGTATGGSVTSIEDDTKDFSTDLLVDKIAKVTINNKEYYRNIATSLGSEIGIEPIHLATAATVTVTGSTGGSMVINCVEPGANNYSVQLVAGTGESQETKVSFADDLLTITSPTNFEGVAGDIMPGNVESIIDNTPELSALFDVGAYNAGFPLDITAEPVAFTGGTDDIPVEAGMAYQVIERVLFVPLKVV